MKRLVGLVVLVVVLSVCVPSYGYFLLYNVSASVKGVNNSTPASIAWKGYLVLDINDSSDDLDDANLIIYGKNSSKAKVYVVLNESDSNGFIDTDLWSQGNFAVFNFWSYGNPSSPFDFEGLVLGKGAYKDIGLGVSTKKWVASSMKGTTMVWEGMLLDADDDIAGTGTVSASLYTVATKAINTYGLTQDQILVDGYLTYPSLINGLKAKGFVAATLP